MSDTAENLVAAILGNEEPINTLANAYHFTSQNTNVNYYPSMDQEIHSLFNRGRYQANFPRDMPALSQEAPAPIYNLHPYTVYTKGPKTEEVRK